MFEAVEVGRKASKSEYAEEEAKLRIELLEAQRAIVSAGVPVYIILSGVEGSGKADMVNRLNEWFDARFVENHAFWDESDEERERPFYWRFWRAMPPRGRIAVMLGSWYTAPIIAAARGELDEARLHRKLARVADFERMLAHDGAAIVKFWFHLSRAAVKEQLQGDGRKSGRPLSPVEKRLMRRYDEFVRVSESAIRVTDSGTSRWHLVDASDRRYRELFVGRTVLEAMRDRLGDGRAQAAPQHAESAELMAEVPGSQLTVLDRVDLSARLDEATYERKLAKRQVELNTLSWKARDARRSSVVVFEGWDAAGKGGAIRRITAAVDARLYRVFPVAAPTDEERAHHYLWVGSPGTELEFAL